MISRHGWRIQVDGINPNWRVGRSLDGGCARRITRLIGSLGRRSLIVDFGRRDGGLGGKMVGVIKLYVYGGFVGVLFSLLFGLNISLVH